MLAAGAVVEAVAGLGLLLAPSMLAELLLRDPLAGAGPIIARLGGGGLLALGIACWFARRTPSTAAGLGGRPGVPRLQPGRVRSPDRGLPTFAERPGRSKCGCPAPPAGNRTVGGIVRATRGLTHLGSCARLESCPRSPSLASRPVVRSSALWPALVRSPSKTCGKHRRPPSLRPWPAGSTLASTMPIDERPGTSASSRTP